MNLAPKLVNLQLALGPFFDEIVSRAEDLFTLDERIDAIRRWYSQENLDDLEDLERMQRERKTRDYSQPGTWYGSLRNWQGMTEAEALASFRTDWDLRGTPQSLEKQKALYQLIKYAPLPDLTPDEEKALYDQRRQPACVISLFAEMRKADLTEVFEATFDYSHTEGWKVCIDDFQAIREALRKIRGDALETFFLAAADVLNENKSIAALENENAETHQKQERIGA